MRSIIGNTQFAGRARVAILATLVLTLPALAAEAPVSKSDWWSFKPATNPTVPRVKSDWPRNDLDRFILAKLQEQRLEPSPEADRHTLIRRLTFDLIGLPPTPEEVSAFVTDRSTDAYEKVTDRLLASPRYGERWARHWLDTVHYGESHGYDKDKPRLNAWPYRDYVIGAFNTDKPYSRFVAEQIAADVLFPDEPRLIPALGFIAAGPWDFVGHAELPITKTDGLIARYNDRDDMVMNAMSTFQSLTVHCARCHDHKFDPITQRDYYGLQAVFAGVDRADRPFDSDASVRKRREALSKRFAELKAAQTNLEAQVISAGGDELRALDARIAESKRSSKPDVAAFGYHSEISLARDVEKWVQVDLGEPRALERIVLVGAHDDFNHIGDGFGFPVRYRIEASQDGEFRAGATLIEDRTQADVPNPGVVPQNIEVCSCLSDDGAPLKARYVRITATRLAPRQGDYIFALGELMLFNTNGANVARGAKVTAQDSIEAPPRWRKQNLCDGYYSGLANSATNAGALARLETERAMLLARSVPEPSRKNLETNESALKEIQKEISQLPRPQMVYAAANEFAPNGAFVAAKEPRPVHLLKRGDVKRPAEEMAPCGVMAVPGISAEFKIANLKLEGDRRAALAKWIIHTNNMLTRRSIVNRIWQYHFGRGIVETPNDFGHMGALPSHPELLDWLAFWFLEKGESIKQLHRLIVTSATYRQSSGVASLKRRVVESGPASPRSDVAPQRLNDSTSDSQNRFLARMNRTRLDAEQFHDAVLAIGGDIDLTMGGPSVQQFAFKDDHSPVYDYARYDLDGPGARRRSVYRFIVRSVPDPLMEALDCPDANILSPVRNTTMTSLQALAALNDAFVIRQCERFAERLRREGNSLEEQMTRACWLAFGRAPTARERQRLVLHAQAHGPASACRVIFNTNEFMFID